MPDPAPPDPAFGGTPSTVAELLRARADDDATGLRFETQTWTWRQVVAESRRRAVAATAWRRPGPFHVGVLLENIPEYVFWLGGAALAGATVVGINPTRRGEELARDVRSTDCQILVTDAGGGALLEGLDTQVAGEGVLRVDDAGYLPVGAAADAVVSPADLLLLLFTSGTTGAPKAVRCTQGRLASIAARAAAAYDFRRDDVCYCPMPLFHGNAVMALWAPALYSGAAVALTRRFSASHFLADVRHHGATRFTYVGKALAYILTTPRSPDDAHNPLRVGFGTEASAPDRREFELRFGCRLVEGYGSSEGGAAINVTSDTPPGSLGLSVPGEDVAVCDPDTGMECPPARFEAGGRLVNSASAIGEIVNRSGGRGFEGYYNDSEADAERVRGGWYWTGDLGYRDEDGYFYFAGRGGERLRVDSENFAAAPVERIVERHPAVAAAAVYAVPDPRSGDRVMAAVELRAGCAFDVEEFADWLEAQPDLGTKWAPRFLRISSGLPLTATG
ncbi:MAG: AMP-binding protein, partial [Acidimicrobiales bacterium]